MAFNFFKIAKGLALKGQSATPTSPANGDIYYDSSANKFKGYENSLWKDMIGGAGSSGINYILNGGAESDITGWATYKDAAAAIPVNGTGGSPSVTLVRSATIPLRGSGQFMFSKGASNLQGEGCSYDFTIDKADINKRLSIQFDIATSSAFVAGDMGVYVYDVTNSVLIYPSSINIPGTNGYPGKVQCYFNTTDSTSYRLIFHVATTNASAYTFYFDGVSVGPQDVVQTVPYSDWITWIPTGSWSNTTYSGFKKRIGDTAFYSIRAALTGAPAGGEFIINLPSNETIDTSKIPDTNAPQCILRGSSGSYDKGDNTFPLYAIYNTTTSIKVGVGKDDDGAGGDSVSINRLTSANSIPDPHISGRIITVEFQVPITEWAGSSVGMANSQVEYASNSDSTATSDTGTSNFAYGPSGSLGISSTPSTVTCTKRVRFLTPVQTTDVLTLEVSDDRLNWVKVGTYLLTSGLQIDSLRNDNSNYIGFAVAGGQYSSTATDILVIYGKYRTGTTSAWSGTWYWRVSKSANPLGIAAHQPTSMVDLYGGNGFGSSSTKIRRFTNVRSNVGSGITYVDSATLGATFTINEAGVYSINYTDESPVGGIYIGITKNSSQLTTNINNCTIADVLTMQYAGENTVAIACSTTTRLAAGDVIRAHGIGSADSTRVIFTITQVAKF